ncbi:MAG: hypothetical protein IJY20_04950 [Clostridia bacterium]|nr:hypothetical protein [Clostridia bacterium]
MKRILALLLLVCMCLPLVACGGAGNNNNNDGPEDNYTFIDAVGDHNFEGAEFVVSLLPAYEWELYKEELEPDACDEAIRKRNSLLQNRFNVEIVPDMVQGQDAPTHANQIRIAMQDGNPDQIDMVLIQRWLSGPVAMTGTVCDLRSEVPYVKDSVGVNPWWDAKINDCYTVYGRQYIGVSDINLTAISSTWAIIFNRSHDQNYALSTHKKIDSKYTSLYDVVDDGAWTLDNMNKIVKDFWYDNPATGMPNEADADDLFGLTVSSSAHFREMFTNAFGYDLVINDGQSTPTLMTLTTGMNSTIMDLRNMTNSSGFNSFDVADWSKNFANGQSLMFITTLATLESETIHDSDVEFGIIPYPKASLNQKEYYSGSNDSMSTIIVPLNTPDRMTRTGAMVEALSAESHQSVLPAYYDIILKYNATRDKDSVRMIEKIYQGRRYNLAEIHSGTGDYLRSGTENGLAYFIRQVTSSGVTQSPADFWDGLKYNYEEGLEDLIAAYEEIAYLASGG